MTDALFPANRIGCNQPRQLKRLPQNLNKPTRSPCAASSDLEASFSTDSDFSTISARSSPLDISVSGPQPTESPTFQPPVPSVPEAKRRELVQALNIKRSCSIYRPRSFPTPVESSPDISQASLRNIESPEQSIRFNVISILTCLTKKGFYREDLKAVSITGGSAYREASSGNADLDIDLVIYHPSKSTDRRALIQEQVDIFSGIFKKYFSDKQQPAVYPQMEQANILNNANGDICGVHLRFGGVDFNILFEDKAASFRSFLRVKDQRYIEIDRNQLNWLPVPYIFEQGAEVPGAVYNYQGYSTGFLRYGQLLLSTEEESAANGHLLIPNPGQVQRGLISYVNGRVKDQENPDLDPGSEVWMALNEAEELREIMPRYIAENKPIQDWINRHINNLLSHYAVTPPNAESLQQQLKALVLFAGIIFRHQTFFPPDILPYYYTILKAELIATTQLLTRFPQVEIQPPLELLQHFPDSAVDLFPATNTHQNIKHFLAAFHHLKSQNLPPNSRLFQIVFASFRNYVTAKTFLQPLPRPVDLVALRTTLEREQNEVNAAAPNFEQLLVAVLDYGKIPPPSVEAQTANLEQVRIIFTEAVNNQELASEAADQIWTRYSDPILAQVLPTQHRSFLFFESDSVKLASRQTSIPAPPVRGKARKPAAVAELTETRFVDRLLQLSTVYPDNLNYYFSFSTEIKALRNNAAIQRLVARLVQQILAFPKDKLSQFIQHDFHLTYLQPHLCTHPDFALQLIAVEAKLTQEGIPAPELRTAICKQETLQSLIRQKHTAHVTSILDLTTLPPSPALIKFIQDEPNNELLQPLVQMNDNPHFWCQVLPLLSDTVRKASVIYKLISEKIPPADVPVLWASFGQNLQQGFSPQLLVRHFQLINEQSKDNPQELLRIIKHLMGTNKGDPQMIVTLFRQLLNLPTVPAPELLDIFNYFQLHKIYITDQNILAKLVEIITNQDDKAIGLRCALQLNRVIDFTQIQPIDAGLAENINQLILRFCIPPRYNQDCLALLQFSTPVLTWDSENIIIEGFKRILPASVADVTPQYKEINELLIRWQQEDACHEIEGLTQADLQITDVPLSGDSIITKRFSRAINRYYEAGHFFFVLAETIEKLTKDRPTSVANVPTLEWLRQEERDFSANLRESMKQHLSIIAKEVGGKEAVLNFILSLIHPDFLGFSVLTVDHLPQPDREGRHPNPDFLNHFKEKIRRVLPANASGRIELVFFENILKLLQAINLPEPPFADPTDNLSYFSATIFLNLMKDNVDLVYRCKTPENNEETLRYIHQLAIMATRLNKYDLNDFLKHRPPSVHIGVMSIDPSFIMLNIRLSLFAYFAVINIRFSHALGGDQRPFLKEIDDILYKLDPSRKANFCIEYIRSMLDRAKIPGQIHPDYLPHVINILKKEDLSLPEQTKKICLKMLFSTFISELHNKNEYAAFLGLLSALYLPNGHNDFNRGVAQYLLELLNSSRDQHDEQYQPLIPPGSLEPFRSLLEQGLTR